MPVGQIQIQQLSYWKAHNAFLLIGLHEVIDEVGVKQSLYYSSNEGSPNNMLPLEYPKSI